MMTGLAKPLRSWPPPQMALTEIALNLFIQKQAGWELCPPPKQLVGWEGYSVAGGIGCHSGFGVFLNLDLSSILFV